MNLKRVDLHAAIGYTAALIFVFPLFPVSLLTTPIAVARAMAARANQRSTLSAASCARTTLHHLNAGLISTELAKPFSCLCRWSSTKAWLGFCRESFCCCALKIRHTGCDGICDVLLHAAWWYGVARQIEGLFSNDGRDQAMEGFREADEATGGALACEGYSEWEAAVTIWRR